MEQEREPLSFHLSLGLTIMDLWNHWYFCPIGKAWLVLFCDPIKANSTQLPHSFLNMKKRGLLSAFFTKASTICPPLTLFGQIFNYRIERWFCANSLQQNHFDDIPRTEPPMQGKDIRRYLQHMKKYPRHRHHECV